LRIRSKRWPTAARRRVDERGGVTDVIADRVAERNRPQVDAGGNAVVADEVKSRAQDAVDHADGGYGRRVADSGDGLDEANASRPSRGRNRAGRRNGNAVRRSTGRRRMGSPSVGRDGLSATSVEIAAMVDGSTESAETVANSARRDRRRIDSGARSSRRSSR